MGRWSRCLGAAILGIALHAAGAADTLPATTPDFAARLAPIRRQLASDDFAAREAGQKELDRLPPAQVASLRTLAAAETDPEVKARLDARIDAMEVYNLVHPAPLSLNVKDATLADIAAQLNQQLSGSPILVAPTVGRALTLDNAGRFTLQAENKPLWEIIAELHRQNPLAVSPVTTSTAATGITTAFRLTASPAAATRTFTVVDTFAITPQISGNPATGNWSIRLQGFSDPRVRIAQYSSQLRIQKITDQNGASLLPLVQPTSTSMSSSSRPVSTWSSAATLAAAPGLVQIKELRALITLSILESEQTVSLDLTKEVPPLNTSRGVITVEKRAPAGLLLRISPSTDAPNPPLAAVLRSTPMSIRVFDQDGKLVQNSTANGTSVSLTVSLPAAAAGVPAAVAAAGAAARVATRVELTWSDKTRDMELPVTLTDLPMPAPAPNPPVRVLILE